MESWPPREGHIHIPPPRDRQSAEERTMHALIQTQRRLENDPLHRRPAKDEARLTGRAQHLGPDPESQPGTFEKDRRTHGNGRMLILEIRRPGEKERGERERDMREKHHILTIAGPGQSLLQVHGAWPLLQRRARIP